MSSRPANDISDVRQDGFFSLGVAEADPEVADAIGAELGLTTTELQWIVNGYVLGYGAHW